ncbi:MAG: hypothetical protein LBT16_08085 [Treponema sp.]|jgi:heptaprenyl diphosphate synthase|nr:hypothetical protein [Treponema sp.]
MKTGEERRRLYRADKTEGLFSGRALFITGICIIPAVVFNPSPWFRLGQFFFFWFLSWLSGKKNNPLITILIMITVVFCNLLVPYGRLILSLGMFKITQGALMAGIQRAATLEALVMLSRLTIRQDLKLPGVLGELITGSFKYLVRITESLNKTEKKAREDPAAGDFSGDLLKRKKFVPLERFAERVDTLLLELSESQGSEGPPPRAVPRRYPASGRFILCAAVLLSWLPLILPFFN